MGELAGGPSWCSQLSLIRHVAAGESLFFNRNTKYEIFIASGTNIKYMETTCNKDMENDKQN